MQDTMPDKGASNFIFIYMDIASFTCLKGCTIYLVVASTLYAHACAWTSLLRKVDPIFSNVQMFHSSFNFRDIPL